MAISGVIKKKLGYVTNFALGAAGSLIALIYTVVFLEDSRKLRPPEVAAEMELREAEARAAMGDDGKTAPPGNVLVRAARGVRGFFNLTNLRTSFYTVFRRRESGVRPYLLLLIVVFILQIFFTMVSKLVYYIEHRYFNCSSTPSGIVFI